jgi:hypothetical protein
LHDFGDHPALIRKVLVMAPNKYKQGYSAWGVLRDLEEGYGAVYWYEEGEIESCGVSDRARRFVEARRQVEYRYRRGMSYTA